MIPFVWFQEAQSRISPYILRTPLVYDPELDIYIKWENRQVTGSFKARGALNKVFSLEPWERDRGIVTASAGNHGQGVALAGKITSTKVLVFASESASKYKLQAIRDLGAELRLVPGGYGEAEAAGLEYAVSENKTWISAYNDGQVIAGQGTLGLEILEALPAHDRYTWLVPCGGGGLISGIGTAVKSASHPAAVQHQVVGVQSEASPYLHSLFYRGTQEGVVEEPSLADGLSGPVEENSITIPLTRKYMDSIVLVRESGIEAAITYAWHHYHEKIEASAATVLAAILTGIVQDRPAVLIISGGNITSELHQIFAERSPIINSAKKNKRGL